MVQTSSNIFNGYEWKGSTCKLHNKTNISAWPKNNEKEMIINREKVLVMSLKNASALSATTAYKGHWEYQLYDKNTSLKQSTLL